MLILQEANGVLTDAPVGKPRTHDSDNLQDIGKHTHGGQLRHDLVTNDK